MCVYVCWGGGGRELLIDWLLKLLMKSGQSALQLAVRAPSGDEKNSSSGESGGRGGRKRTERQGKRKDGGREEKQKGKRVKREAFF